MIPLPSIEDVVVLDRRADMAKATSDNLRQRFGAHVVSFTEARAACRSVQENEAIPGLAVNDRIGMNEVPALGDSFDGMIRAASPLTFIILFSGSAFKNPTLVKQWEDEGRIDLAVEKKKSEDLYELIRQIRFRWNSDAARKLRNHIAAHANPTWPCMSDGTKELSLIDEYREILKGTADGERYAADWVKILTEPVKA